MANETVEIKKDTLYKAIILILVIVVAFMYFGDSDSGSGNNYPAPTPTPSGNAPTPSPIINMDGLEDDDAVLGDADAPVTIVEWSDYECPFCARFYSQTYDQIKSKYIETGKVKLVFRDFPLSFHNNAQKAAEAAECAGEQGKYYEMHDLLFESGVTGGVASYKQYAASIGLDQGDF
ncbi:MAG: protein-disulfide isomerase, partial [Patescibacteria group bacterium]